MPLAPQRPNVLQPLDVVLHQPLRVALDRHGGQLGRQGRDDARVECAQLRRRVDGVLGQDAARGLRAESPE